jgi:hypothetical protein
MEQHEHSELCAIAKLVCNAFEAVQVRLGVSSLQSHLGVTFERVQTRMKEVLHLGVHHALAIFRSHCSQLSCSDRTCPVTLTGASGQRDFCCVTRNG